ncbi:hypothetical protein GQX74_013870 [Glossina fuscipes]|nr:hypothetical protein GQX74_013870 [Glossina fuscipes]
MQVSLPQHAISYSTDHSNHNELAGGTRVDRNLSRQNNIRRSSRSHPLATTTTTNQHLHQPQDQQQYEYLTPSHHPHQRQYHHHRHNAQNQRQSPSTTQPAGNSTTGLSLSKDATVTTTAQRSKSCFRPTSHAYTNQIPAKLLPNSRSAMINSELAVATNTDDGSGNDGEADGSNSLTPWDLATEALRDSHPIDRERLLNLLQRIVNESQQYQMQNQLLKGLFDLGNE